MSRCAPDCPNVSVQMPMLNIAPLTPADYGALASLFAQTVRQSTGDHYSVAQREAWAQGALDPRFINALRESLGWVAWWQSRRIGFVTLDTSAHVGLLYVDAAHQRQGVGGSLLDTLMAFARLQRLPRLETEASLLSLGLFLSRGFNVCAVEQVDRKGVIFTRHRLQCLLSMPLSSLQ